MFEPVFESLRTMTEANIQMQQEMFKKWVGMWPGAPAPNGGEQIMKAQKKWADATTDMLTKHRETLDAQYRAGIKTIEDAFRVGEAKDPEQFRRLAEELWRQSIECLTTIVEAQLKDVQAAMQKWFELTSQGAALVKKG